MYTIDFQQISQKDYYSFGAVMPGRSFYSGSYRYGFNGKENDNEVKGVESSTLDFGARIYDSRLGKWFATDPLQTKYADKTPYGFCSENPSNRIDPDGRDDIHFYTYQKSVWINGAWIALGHTTMWYSVIPNNKPNTYTLHGLTTQIGKDYVKNLEINSNLTGGEAGKAIINFGVDKAAQYSLIEQEYSPFSSKSITNTAERQVQNLAALARRQEQYDKVTNIMFSLIGFAITDAVFDIGELLTSTRVWTTASDGNFAGSLATRLGSKRIIGVDVPFQSNIMGTSGDIDLMTTSLNIEVKSGNKLNLEQAAKNMAYSASQGKEYYLYMPKATKAMIYDARVNYGVSVIKDESTLKTLINTK